MGKCINGKATLTTGRMKALFLPATDPMAYFFFGTVTTSLIIKKKTERTEE